MRVHLTWSGNPDSLSHETSSCAEVSSEAVERAVDAAEKAQTGEWSVRAELLLRETPVLDVPTLL